MIMRSATLADIGVLREFERDLINVERAFDADLLQEGLIYYDLESLIASDDSELLVVEENSAPVACGYMQLRDAKCIYEHSRIGYIGFLYVLPSARGKGLVQIVIDHLCGWARDQGVTHIELGVYTDNAGAIKAYERAGFTAVAQTMLKRID